MNNNLLQIKIKERLNKLDSQDYDNVECWQITEAFNKAQLEWSRELVHGYNQRQQGDESSKFAIDDLQMLLETIPVTVTQRDGYYESDLIPLNYLWWKRVQANTLMDCCPPRRLKVHLSEAANIDDMLNDEFKKPSAEWGESFAVLIGNRIRIYTNNEFGVQDVNLIYYRRPTDIQINGCINLTTGLVNTVNIDCEFKDDIAEILVDYAVSILAGDVESFNTMQKAQQNVITTT
ncbi:MAG: hypothetical protein EOL95_10420 [Bacteroidia bacterium]|nr:hypothetical protein [Bacteroidia bacterium]